MFLNLTINRYSIYDLWLPRRGSIVIQRVENNCVKCFMFPDEKAKYFSQKRHTKTFGFLGIS